MDEQGKIASRIGRMTFLHNPLIDMLTSDLVKGVSLMISDIYICPFIFDEIKKLPIIEQRPLLIIQHKFKDKGLKCWSGAVIFSTLLSDLAQGAENSTEFSFKSTNLIIEDGLLIKGKIESRELNFSADTGELSFIQAMYEKYGEEKTIEFVKNLSLVVSEYVRVRNENSDHSDYSCDYPSISYDEFTSDEDVCY